MPQSKRKFLHLVSNLQHSGLVGEEHDCRLRERPRHRGEYRILHVVQHHGRRQVGPVVLPKGPTALTKVPSARWFLLSCNRTLVDIYSLKPTEPSSSSLYPPTVIKRCGMNGERAIMVTGPSCTVVSHSTLQTVKNTLHRVEADP